MPSLRRDVVYKTTLEARPCRNKPNDRSRLFGHLMSEGKVSIALRLLAEDSKDGVLSPDTLVPSGLDPSGKPILHTVRNILLEKHNLPTPLYL